MKLFVKEFKNIGQKIIYHINILTNGHKTKRLYKKEGSIKKTFI